MTVFSTPERVVISRTRGVTSWSMSRSTVTIVVSRSSLPVELLGDGADDVVGLEPGHLVDRDPQRLHDLAHLRELVAQVVRHPLAGRLVLGVLLVPERGTRAGRTRPRGSRAGGPGGRAGRCSRSRTRRSRARHGTSSAAAARSSRGRRARSRRAASGVPWLGLRVTSRRPAARCGNRPGRRARSVPAQARSAVAAAVAARDPSPRRRRSSGGRTTPRPAIEERAARTRSAERPVRVVADGPRASIARPGAPLRARHRRRHR